MKNKFGSKRVVFDNIKFHSESEGRYYLILKTMEEKGDIFNLELQPTFCLMEPFTKNGRKVLAIKYIADFKYTNSKGESVIIDVKNPETLTSHFKDKYKLWDKMYPDLELTFIHSVTFEPRTLKEMVKEKADNAKARKERKAKRGKK